MKEDTYYFAYALPFFVVDTAAGLMCTFLLVWLLLSYQFADISSFRRPSSRFPLLAPLTQHSSSANHPNKIHCAYGEEKAIIPSSISSTSTPSTPSIPIQQTSRWTHAIPYEDLVVGVLKESASGENRVAQTPTSLSLLIKKGFKALVQSTAGAASSHSDSEYEAIGASIVSSGEEIIRRSDVIVKVLPPTEHEAELLQDGKTWISLLYPAQNSNVVQKLQYSKATVFALDQIPRLLSRGQAYDVLSSQANVGEYFIHTYVIHTYMHAYTYTYTVTCIHTYMHIYIQFPLSV